CERRGREDDAELPRISAALRRRPFELLGRTRELFLALHDLTTEPAQRAAERVLDLRKELALLLGHVLLDEAPELGNALVATPRLALALHLVGQARDRLMIAQRLLDEAPGDRADGRIENVALDRVVQLELHRDRLRDHEARLSRAARALVFGEELLHLAMIRAQELDRARAFRG